MCDFRNRAKSVIAAPGRAAFSGAIKRGDFEND
jgi:hypothetical protein